MAHRGPYSCTAHMSNGTDACNAPSVPTGPGCSGQIGKKPERNRNSVKDCIKVAPTYQFIKRAVAVIGFAVHATDLEHHMMASVCVTSKICSAPWDGRGATLKTIVANTLSGC